MSTDKPLTNSARCTSGSLQQAGSWLALARADSVKRAITVLWLPSVSGMARRLVRLSKRQSRQLASACYCHKDLDR